MKNIFILASLFLIIIIIVYFYLYPSVFFDNYYKYKNVSVYSDKDIDHNDFTKVISNVSKNFTRKNIIFNDDVNVYLCDSKIKLQLLTPSDGSAFAYNQLVNKLLISRTEINKDLVFANLKSYNIRKLSGVLTHEFTHSYLHKTLGVFSSYYIDKWKIEGYCDYVANETSFPRQKGLNQFASNFDDSTYSYQYFVYYLRVKYLLDIRKLTTTDFWDLKMDINDLDEEIRKWLKKTPKNVDIILRP